MVHKYKYVFFCKTSLKDHLKLRPHRHKDFIFIYGSSRFNLYLYFRMAQCSIRTIFFNPQWCSFLSIFTSVSMKFMQYSRHYYNTKYQWHVYTLFATGLYQVGENIFRSRFSPEKKMAHYHQELSIFCKMPSVLIPVFHIRKRKTENCRISETKAINSHYGMANLEKKMSTQFKQGNFYRKCRLMLPNVHRIQDCHAFI